MDVSLAALRSRLYALRSWDSTGTTLDNRIRAALNLALDRIAGDIPEALVPDEEHIVLLPDVDGQADVISSKVCTFDNDKRLLYFVDTAGVSIGAAASATSWTPTVTGEWDGIMHLEITDSTGRIRRRQSREWFKVTSNATLFYVVSLDRPMPDIIAANAGQDFRIHQPEFFFADDVMEVLEPAKIFDSSRQKVTKIATSSANRDDLFDFQGSATGRPHTCWRDRHFQIPAPTQAPAIVEVDIRQPKIPPQKGAEVKADDVKKPPVEKPPHKKNSWASASIAYEGPTSEAVIVDESAKLPEPDGAYKWNNEKSLRSGTWAIRYTYVWGRRDDEFQQSPSIAPGGDEDHDSSFDLSWAYETGSVTSTVSRYTGIHDPVWESAPSPVTVVEQKDVSAGVDGALVLSATNIDSMLGFGDPAFFRFSRSGLRIRYYVAHIDKTISGRGEFNSVEIGEKFYLLCEVEPTFDHVAALSAAGTAAPSGLTGIDHLKGGRVVWNGSQIYDYYRPLKHSTGYYAWQVYPQQDQRYELDFRVLRLPRKFVDAQDTAPIQRDAVPCLIELALYYVSLDDGNDQTSAQAHLNRYHELMRGFRDRYANVGGAVTPVPFTGHRDRSRYGTFGSLPLED